VLLAPHDEHVDRGRGLQLSAGLHASGAAGAGAPGGGDRPSGVGHGPPGRVEGQGVGAHRLGGARARRRRQRRQRRQLVVLVAVLEEAVGRAVEHLDGGAGPEGRRRRVVVGVAEAARR